MDVDYLFYSKHVIPTTPENKEGFPLAARWRGGRRTANCDFFTPLIVGNEAAGCSSSRVRGESAAVNTSERNGVAAEQEAEHTAVLVS